MIGLYSGRDIVARKANGEILTRTQTAASAYNAITKKYGDISASAKYFHRGRGNWVRYSITNDRKRTGKTTNDIKKWRASPHKLDYEGIDTADTRPCGKSLSTAALTTSCEMVRRSGSRKIPTNKYHDVHGKLKFGKFVGRYKDIAYTYHPEQNTLSFKWDMVGKHTAIPLQFKTLRDVEVNNRLMTKHEVVEFAKKSIDIVIRGVDNVFYKTNRNLSHDEVARATKTGKYARVEEAKKNLSAFVKDPNKLERMAKIRAKLKLQKKPTGRKAKVQKDIRKAITKHMPKPIKTKTVKTKYIYGSFQRPIWNGFDPGVKYKLLSNITDAYRDPRWNRKPHDVIITESPISAEKQYALQLTDIAQGKKMNAMIKRVNAIKSLGDNMKGSLISQILKGVDPAVINKYIEKGKAAGKRGAKRVNRDKLSVAERAPDVKASTGTKPATFDLKNNPNRKEFVSDYTGITDHLQRRAKRVAKIHTDRDKGCHKDADTRRREASHARYKKRADKMRTSYPKKR